jgi:hypothetical protein
VRRRTWFGITLVRSRPSRHRQQQFAFVDRAVRRERWFKLGITLGTLAVMAGAVTGTSVGKYVAGWCAGQVQLAIERSFGIDRERAAIDSLWRLKRDRAVRQTIARLGGYYQNTDPAMRRLFDVAAMAPANGLVRWGRGDDAFVVSSEVFEADDHGRSFQMRPNMRSIWLRQITLRNGPLGMFLVPDTPEARAAAGAAGAIVDERSAQRTNSWGCRGREPDLAAAFRVLVLGDSFMQAMFNGEDQTPACYLEQELRQELKHDRSVSVLNTGHIGYAPEQYYFTLRDYGDRFRPHFVVVSVCPNDFGEYFAVIRGEGDSYEEAAYWLSQIMLWCRARNVSCLLVPVACESQFIGPRKDAAYPGRVVSLFEGAGAQYLDPLEAFLSEHLKLTQDPSRMNRPGWQDPLFNEPIKDNHFSPEGAALWARVVARRIARIDEYREAGNSSGPPAWQPAK